MVSYCFNIIINLPHPPLLHRHAQHKALKHGLVFSSLSSFIRQVYQSESNSSRQLEHSPIANTHICLSHLVVIKNISTHYSWTLHKNGPVCPRLKNSVPQEGVFKSHQLLSRRSIIMCLNTFSHTGNLSLYKYICMHTHIIYDIRTTCTRLYSGGLLSISLLTI